MKNLIVLAAIVMLFGCVAQPAPEENVSTAVTNMSNVSVPGDAFAAKAVDGKFMTVDYSFLDNSNPFSDGAGGDLGKTSTAYIKIDQSNLNFLAGGCDGNEKQAFWINPIVREGKGIIFDAVYSIDTEGDCYNLKFLGREYWVIGSFPPNTTGSVLRRGGEIVLRDKTTYEVVELKDGSSLNNDDRWKVVLGWKNNKLAKVIVYMEGYFYDIEEGEKIGLFGSEELMAMFEDLGSGPVFKLIAVAPSSVKTEETAGSQQTVQEDEVSVRFEPPLPVYYSQHGAENQDREYLKVNQGVNVSILNKSFVLTCLEFDNRTNSSRVCLGDDEINEVLHGYYCDEYSPTYLNINGKKIGFVDLSIKTDNVTAIMCELSDNETCEEKDWFRVPAHESTPLPDGGILYIGVYQPCAYTFCNRYINISYFSREIILEDGVDGVKLTWENETSWNPSLRSISIPANSSAYEKLASSR